MTTTTTPEPSLSDPAYFAAIVRDMTTSPPSEAFGMLCCSICGGGPIVASGLCNACAWEELYQPNYEVYDFKDYSEKHGV